MTIALLGDDRVTAEIVRTLLARIDLPAVVLGRPNAASALDAYVAALRDRFDEVVVLDGDGGKHARRLSIEPSVEAWLTRDAAANEKVLGSAEIPPADDAAAWLRSRELPTSGGRRSSGTVDGQALARELDLGTLARFSSDFRSLVGALRPGWTTTRVGRRRGRPPGIALFRGTGYAFCLELLHRGRGASITPAELSQALGRTKTPMMRLVHECERRGYLRRTSARGPLVIANLVRLVDDLVTGVKAERVKQPLRALPLATDRDPGALPARLARFLREYGGTMAVTGAAAVADLGGNRLIGDVPRAYTAGIDLVVERGRLADAHVDPRAPALILVELPDEAVLHRMRPGTPPLVSTWQAVIDMLTSASEREREVGTTVRRRLEEHGDA